VIEKGDGMHLEEKDKIIKLGIILNYLETRIPERFSVLTLGQGSEPPDEGYRVDQKKSKIVVTTTKGEFTGNAIVLNGRDIQIVYSITSIPPNMYKERAKAMAMAFNKTRDLKMYIKLYSNFESYKNPFDCKEIDVDKICGVDIQKLKKGWFG
jgi:hypothetical protein